ncbi:MAG: ABC transporter ATP-binding protein [Armatimonadetes bacterium]|nr:ABC transporter ATP-binding protein [Armatimonadota bacterium]
MPVVELKNLTVQYGEFKALQDFTCTIPEGCIGLLGPNGAGKTTLIKTLLGFVEPAEGSAKVLGIDITKEPREVRRRVGYMPEQDCHIPGMTGVGYVAYLAELAGLPPNQALRRAHEVLEYCGLGEARYRNVETFSTGMKQRIKLAQALVHGPKLLLLDEPTNGLDPRGRDEMLKLIIDISRNKQVNVIVSSHLLPDIEKTCQEVVVVFGGRLRKQGNIAELKKIEGLPIDIELKEPSPDFVSALLRRQIMLLNNSGYNYRVQASGAPAVVNRLVMEAARESKAQVRMMKPAERSLEEAFLEVIR